ncbi:hypothetical protein HMPREF9243_1783 [Aerococcus sp. Group 1]|nr:hypothetical protein HMPREF9243_1783 [Aerococcus sp. Group 1]
MNCTPNISNKLAFSPSNKTIFQLFSISKKRGPGLNQVLKVSFQL